MTSLRSNRSNNSAFTHLEIAADDVETPPAGKQKTFIDISDHKYKRKDSDGVVSDIESTLSRVKLYDHILLSAGTFSVTGISESYANLEIILTGRCATNDVYWVAFEINDDTTDSNYIYTRWYFGSGTGNVASTGRGEFGPCAGNNSPANHFGFTHAFIYEYASASHTKTIHSEGFAMRQSDRYSEINDLNWLGTAGITKLEFWPGSVGSAYNFAAGSRLQIFGLT